ncbi:MAG: arginine--tRNA ligase [Gammaproteobacteria bacterium]|jgi:arginyl-tRNA synthetase|nr:arginine--tRNA ligase [Gammaproteobacteria bacterium]MBT3490285.1 arginine--tRNA ligase [Gammaproteobacteria bacterium]MBT3719300.1 arginine--tRNA ligase [Gammaproteobacteria bacterium]MBT3845537.1 arginine--tRNA ligase [Gammaproteobacteria bacterium]MBT3893357.1 arginine--tRNA ligase [Gammaproteobacteria bacterium]
MKQQLQQLVAAALDILQTSGALQLEQPPTVLIERTRDQAHGDFATNVAMVLSKQARRNPRELAQLVMDALPENSQVLKCEIAGPGFINFFLTQSAYSDLVESVLEQGERFGRCEVGSGEKVLMEYVSANPTGPLHVGHGRGAAYGAATANLLRAAGYQVHCEYYVNDAGRQMDILAASVWLRYLDLCGEAVTFPSNGYRGDYIWDIAASLHREHQEQFLHPIAQVMEGVVEDEPAGDKEVHIDGIIAQARALLGAEDYNTIHKVATDAILGDIRQDLEEFGVVYDEWFSERSLMDSQVVDRAIEKLQASGDIYEEKGALWFRSTAYGDEKDRVVVRDNGLKTYFASDIAYHMNKLQRGFGKMVDIWGADHHGYVPRVRAALTAMGEEASTLEVLLVQFASLYRGGEKVQMSTRSGSFVTLRELRDEVGNDAARFFYVLRKSEQHMDFDLDLARSESSENPVYYIQYAHARIHSVLRQLRDKGMVWDSQQGIEQFSRLVEPHEKSLMVAIARYPELLESAALQREPHQIAHYLRDLAHELHTYYNAHHFIVEDQELRNARITLISAARQVFVNGLQILGVSAPQEM